MECASKVGAKCSCHALRLPRNSQESPKLFPLEPKSPKPPRNGNNGLQLVDTAGWIRKKKVVPLLPPLYVLFPHHRKKRFRLLLHELREERLRHRPHHYPRAIQRKVSNYLTTTSAARTGSSRTLRMDAALRPLPLGRHENLSAHEQSHATESTCRSIPALVSRP
jgi:hypothetical protein